VSVGFAAFGAGVAPGFSNRRAMRKGRWFGTGVSLLRLSG